MSRLLYPLLTFLVAVTLNVQAKDLTKSAPYFPPSAVDIKALLPDPPADGSSAEQQEVQVLLHDQAVRTPAQVKRIQREAKHLDVWLFDTVFGAWFTKANLPATSLLFARISATEYPIIEDAKKFWHRPRPSLQDKRIHPPIELPRNDSYPSGHSTVGNLYGMILAQMVPDLKGALLARGKQIGDDRIIAGVHFPSDVAAGVTLASNLFQRLDALPDFQADLAKAQAEIAAARAKK